MYKTITSLLVTASLLPASINAMAAEGTVTASTGFNNSSGVYGGNATTRIRSIPIDLAYESGAWSFKLSAPYIDVAGPTNVIPGVGAVKNSNLILRGGILGVGPRGSAPSASPSAQSSAGAWGIGDVTTMASFNFYEDPAAQFGLSLSGKIKFGTADRNKGLGTGENDYGAELAAYKKLDRVSLFGGVGYTKLGSSPYIALKNAANATVGSAFKLDESRRLGIAYEYRQRVADAGTSRREATLFYGYGNPRGWKTQLYALKGLTDGGPDWGAGLTVANSF